MHQFKKTIIVTAVALMALSANAQKYTNDWKSIDSRPVPEWFKDAKFGIFIHWGLYSVPSFSPSRHDGEENVYCCYAEHYWRRLMEGVPAFTEFNDRVYGNNADYRDFADDFKAEMFKPEVWADILKGSGAQYVVLTSKHHEGFCLWPSRYSPHWNAVEAGPHRDVLGDLTSAVREKGMKMGYYYSLLEWCNPLYSEETLDEYIDTHMFPQMKELVEEYHPDIVWTDGEWDYTSDRLRSTEFLQWLYNESSVKDYVAVNDRWGKDTRSLHGGFYTTEYDLVHDGNVGKATFHHPWEECRGIGFSFGYNRNELLQDYTTSEQLVRMLVDKVARGGNFLLNIGPTADGRIPVIMQQRLKDIGDWLAVNGEAIYGSRQWDGAPAVNRDTEVFYTSKDDALYVIMTEWQDKPITVKGLKNVKDVTMLGYEGKVSWSRSNGGVTIKPAAIHSPSDIPCQYAWVYKISLNSR